MEIISSEISKGAITHRRHRPLFRGGIITFSTCRAVYDGDMFVLSLNDKNYYYKASEILAIDRETLEVSAVESGYIGSRLSRQPKFDVRELIGLKLKKVTDDAVIQRVLHAESLT